MFRQKKIDVHDAPLSPLYKLHSYCYWENFMTLEFGKCDFVFRKFTQLLVLLWRANYLLILLCAVHTRGLGAQQWWWYSGQLSRHRRPH